MKVLMFGWEFPPYISGGLGTACYGMTKGLSCIEGMEILFVVPKAHGKKYTKGLELIAAEDIVIKKQKDLPVSLKKALGYIEVESKLIPYIDP